MKRLAVVLTHPIQYFVPLWRLLAARPDLSIHVFYSSDHSISGGLDKGFGLPVKWDVPLLEGYPSSFMTKKPWFAHGSKLFEFDRKDVNDIFVHQAFDGLLVTAYDRKLHLDAVGAANRAKVPVLIRCENMDCTGVKRNPVKEKFRRTFLKWLYHKISGFLAIGSCTRRHFLEHGVAQESIFSSPYNVDDALFENQREFFAGRRDKIREAFGFEQNDFVFLFSGKMISKKNPLIIPSAFSRMLTKDKAAFLAVGAGDLRQEFERRMKEVLGKRAVFVGFINQSELGRYYTAADALILPSAYGETWGLVVNEAQIFGLPVIVSDTVGCREDLVIPGETGYIFPSGDATALAECMSRLAQNPQNARVLGDRGRQRVKGHGVTNAVQGIVDGLEYVTRISK